MNKRFVSPITIVAMLMGFLFCGMASNLFAQHTYYINASGNDAHTGLTPKQAWKSFIPLNKINLHPGDSILLHAGDTISGTIYLNEKDNGLQHKPVTIGSYGKGLAYIAAGDSSGLISFNASHFKLEHLYFLGNGTATNRGSGILFYANDSLHWHQNITIDDCHAKGFHEYGIYFSSDESKATKGFQHVRITHCTASENGQGGISSYAGQDDFHHQDFYIAWCKVFNNYGLENEINHNTGNGIVMGQVKHLLIEHCEAFNNGINNHCNAGGPVGIWVWMCKQVIIQYCVSHNNHTSSTKDGGGFDIDGGSSNCVLQYNYAYNNDGAGYLLAEYGALQPFTHNIIRYNISENDGRKNNYGGIHIWGAAPNYAVNDSYIYNNTIYTTDANVATGKPACIRLDGNNSKGVVIANNVFVAIGNTYIINSDSSIYMDRIEFIHNNYHAKNSTNTYTVEGETYNDLGHLFKIWSGHEYQRSKWLALSFNPFPKNSPDTTLAHTVHDWSSLVKIFSTANAALALKIAIPDKYFGTKQIGKDPVAPGVIYITKEASLMNTWKQVANEAWGRISKQVCFSEQ